MQMVQSLELTTNLRLGTLPSPSSSLTPGYTSGLRSDGILKGAHLQLCIF